MRLNLQQARRVAERTLIDQALAEAAGNVSKAAALLGVSRPTLYDLIEDHAIAIKQLRDPQLEHAKDEK
jgi:DNA-binding NtrC family response regulator